MGIRVGWVIGFGFWDGLGMGQMGFVWVSGGGCFLPVGFSCFLAVVGLGGWFGSVCLRVFFAYVCLG